MKIKQVYKLIEDVEAGEIFQFEDDIYIKSNSSHPKAGFQCVSLKWGNLMYVDKGTKVTEVVAELRVISPVPKR